MNKIIEVKNISKIFQGEEVDTHAISEVSFNIDKGEYISIIGPSGSGKSTLLSILGLLDTPSNGSYKLNGSEVSQLSSKQLTTIRNKEIGFIFQSFNLLNDLTVRENVALPLSFRKDIKKSAIPEMVEHALLQVDMAHRLDHFPYQLSGGQQQRIAVARALVGDPALLLADEPTGNLDQKNASQVLELLDTLHGEGATICLVTHDPHSAERTQRQLTLVDGQLTSTATTSKDLEIT